MYRTNFEGFGQLLTEQDVQEAVAGYGAPVPTEYDVTVLSDYGMAVPDEYDISPMEYYNYEFYGMDAMPTADETKSWLKRNWPWLAVGGVGLVGLGIVLKVVL
jgi:hypothetical protein